ncbi:Glycosidase [Parapedobacter luteus]|uniref:Glycosidase n=1 Tax=Parapedobacter luteus TaxID=623280 RepID=A0A1T4ZVI8_9SPHI|nr:glycoside hydrolase family 13 protein [Parapedobacter luteus]SKB26625.1 Glycosidase [Parapedobacter luteus]
MNVLLRMNVFFRWIPACLLALSLGMPAGASGQSVARVEPLHWWVGMHNPELQLLVYGENIAAYEPEIVFPGVQLTQVHRVENPNYLFLDLHIAPSTTPGNVPIVFNGSDGRTFSWEYELKAREADRTKAQGVRSDDVIYLIMPDRFANGDTSNDIVPGMRETALNRDSMYYRHGGDLQGIINKLDYLHDLGVTALWLNPVLTNDMEQASYHGYAATENYQVDPRFGDNELYRKLADELHRRGMKLIKDLVHNHVGLRHWTVLDPPAPDWLNQWPTYTNTTYKDQVIFDPYAAEADRKRMTDGWFVPTMPDMNHRNPYVRKYITQSHIWWVEYAGVDGFRLDTYPYNDLDFMADWGRLIKAEYPELTFFGETWVHGVPNQAVYTQGSTINQRFDTHMPGVTDFQTHFAIIEALNGSFGWTDGVNRLYSVLANDFVYEDAYRNVVFLDNHDKSRFFSEVGENVDKYKSGLAWLMTTRGIPQLYYGAEIAMKNFANPDGMVREDFPGGWPADTVDKFTEAGRSVLENDIFQYIRTLANYRKSNPVLQTGRMMQYVPEDAVYVYFRYNDEKTVMVVMNTGEDEAEIDVSRFEERIRSATRAKDIINGNTVNLTAPLRLNAKSTAVLELL